MAGFDPDAFLAKFDPNEFLRRTERDTAPVVPAGPALSEMQFTSDAKSASPGKMLVKDMAKGVTEALPAIGSVIGGAAGGTAAGAASLGVGAVSGAIAGAGIGAAAGSSVQQAIDQLLWGKEQSATATLKNIGTETLKGAATEILGQGTGKALSTVIPKVFAGASRVLIGFRNRMSSLTVDAAKLTKFSRFEDAAARAGALMADEGVTTVPRTQRQLLKALDPVMQKYGSLIEDAYKEIGQSAQTLPKLKTIIEGTLEEAKSSAQGASRILGDQDLRGMERLIKNYLGKDFERSVTYEELWKAARSITSDKGFKLYGPHLPSATASAFRKATLTSAEAISDTNPAVLSKLKDLNEDYHILAASRDLLKAEVKSHTGMQQMLRMGSAATAGYVTSRLAGPTAGAAVTGTLLASEAAKTTLSKTLATSGLNIGSRVLALGEHLGKFAPRIYAAAARGGVGAVRTLHANLMVDSAEYRKRINELGGVTPPIEE